LVISIHPIYFPCFSCTRCCLLMCSLLCGKAQPVCWLMLPPAPVLVEESGKGSRRKQPGQKLGSSNAQQQQQLSCWAARPAWVCAVLSSLIRGARGMCRQKLPRHPAPARRLSLVASGGISIRRLPTRATGISTRRWTDGRTPASDAPDADALQICYASHSQSQAIILRA
jgi:hypothetical protein